MPSFDSPAALHKEASALYRDAKYAAAALIWARGREAAQTLGDRAAGFSAGYWEAEAWKMGEDLHRALGLIFSLLSDVPPDAPAFARWLAEKLLFNIQKSLRPERVRLQSLLSQLEVLAEQQTSPAGDLPFCRGELNFLSGAWEQALRHFASGWQTDHRWGSTKHDFAWRAIQCCLRLGRIEEAESWWQHLSVTNRDWADARQMLKVSTLLLSLHAAEYGAVAGCVENGCDWNHLQLRGQLYVRGASLDPLHDPSDHSHPARKLADFERTQNVHDRYDSLLALVDYRLACLRFTAGLPAVDDLFYRQPDALDAKLSLADPIKFQRQFRSFLISWHLALRHAKRIDALLECDWRTQEVMSRRQRAEAIVAACHTSLDPSP